MTLKKGLVDGHILDGDQALGSVLADDEAVELGVDLARGLQARRRGAGGALHRAHRSISAAGDQFLQIEQWPQEVRMFAGASVHLDMLEIRPATSKNDTA